MKLRRRTSPDECQSVSVSVSAILISLFQVVLLINGPTEDGRPSTAYAPAARYAKELRDAGTDIYVVNPGYRINEDEGRTIATSVGNVKYSYYRGLDRYQDPMIQGIFGGKINV